MGAPGREDPPARSIVLVAPRDPDADLVLDRLGSREERTDVRRCTTVEVGLEAAREESADVLLFAITDSPDAVLEDIRRAAASDPDVPIALIGEDLDPVVAGRAVEAGADQVMEAAELTERDLDRALELAGARHRGRKADLAGAHLTRAMLDSLPEHVAVLDARGEILAVNDAWLSFARSEGGDPRGYEGDNYLRVTESAAERGIEDAGEVLEGIHGILAGERERFSLEYPCHSPEEKRWFRISPERLDRFDRWFDRWGPVAVPVSNALLFTRGMLTVPAGFAEMDDRQFVVYSAAGTLVFESILAALYFAGSSLLF